MLDSDLRQATIGSLRYNGGIVRLRETPIKTPNLTDLSDAQRLDLKRKLAAAREAKRRVEAMKDKPDPDHVKISQGLMKRRKAKQRGYL